MEAKPTHGHDAWVKNPGLRLGIGKSKGRGRIQIAVRRAFIAHGDVITSSDVYRWCRGNGVFGQWERWSITRVLMTMADRVGHGTGRGRPWLWRKRENMS
jgi:hypothetical protein